MKKSGFTDSQIISILKQAEAGAKVPVTSVELPQHFWCGLCPGMPYGIKHTCVCNGSDCLKMAELSSNWLLMDWTENSMVPGVQRRIRAKIVQCEKSFLIEK